MAEMCRDKLMRHIQHHSFMATELQLYLDTHPCDTRALEQLNCQLKKRREYVNEYQRRFSALTYDGLMNTRGYNWIESPWPWEKEG